MNSKVKETNQNSKFAFRASFCPFDQNTLSKLVMLDVHWYYRLVL